MITVLKRIKIGQNSGGQKGQKVKILEMTTSLYTIIELISDYCLGCGASLKGKPTIKGKFWQIVDIPPIKAIYI